MMLNLTSNPASLNGKMTEWCSYGPVNTTFMEMAHTHTHAHTRVHTHLYLYLLLTAKTGHVSPGEGRETQKESWKDDSIGC